MTIIIYSILVAFLVSTLIGPLLIPLLHKMRFGQNIREDGPRSHQKKSGTPTIGGMIFILSTLICIPIIMRNPNGEVLLCIVSFLGFGLIGFADDVLKVIHKKNLGLRAYQKMIFLLILSGFLAVSANMLTNNGTDIIVPFLHMNFDLGYLYVPFIVFFFLCVTNGVNLTDGLDGLATSVTLLVMTFFTIVAFFFGHLMLAAFCGIVSGALLGFLKFNVYPARVFMGDTGSLALGGVVAAVAMILKLPLLVLIVGGIYVVEMLSVVIQVTSFKLTGKRVFKMSPIHHHFELSGWHETRIVAVFSIITVLLCLVAFLSLSVLP